MRSKKEFKFSNGDRVIEQVTGFKGIITATCFYLTGCSQYLVTAKANVEGKAPTALWYDEGRLELVEDKVFEPEDVQGEDNGCDLPPPIGARGN